jgi:hypothetical protein
MICCPQKRRSCDTTFKLLEIISTWHDESLEEGVVALGHDYSRDFGVCEVALFFRTRAVETALWVASMADEWT